MNLDKETEMKNTDRFHASLAAWESGALGRDEKHVRRASKESEKSFQDASELQLISIRLHKKLIEDLKEIARHNGLGYQPLIRQLLTRFVVAEFRSMRNDAIAETRLKTNKIKKPAPRAAVQRARKAA